MRTSIGCGCGSSVSWAAAIRSWMSAVSEGVAPPTRTPDSSTTTSMRGIIRCASEVRSSTWSVAASAHAQNSKPIQP
ncbi:Uncharacterised protein [Mycobacteroides abscessus subsp. abscessus]|nr:Uncharacterised protein [Mycobacteroides abscessus subsp. abscessus]